MPFAFIVGAFIFTVLVNLLFPQILSDNEISFFLSIIASFSLFVVCYHMLYTRFYVDALRESFDLQSRGIIQLQNRLDKVANADTSLSMIEEALRQVKLPSIAEHSPLLTEVQDEAWSLWCNSIQKIPNGFRIVGEQWARECVERFWERLYLIQKRNGKNAPFHVFSSHCVDPGLLLNGEHAANTLTTQELFVKAGGKFHRYLIRRVFESMTSEGD